MRTFYTYLWLREDGTPYYVGKGSGTRAWRKGTPHRDRVLVQEFPSEEDAFLAEKFLIAFYGRKDLSEGCLINLTDGGDGASGAVRSDEFREMKRIAALGNQYGKGKVPTLEHRSKISKALQGIQRSEEYRTKQRIAHEGVHYSKERCHQMSVTRTGMLLYPPPAEGLKWCGYKKHFVNLEGFNKNANRCRVCASEDNRTRIKKQNAVCDNSVSPQSMGT